MFEEMDLPVGDSFVNKSRGSMSIERLIPDGNPIDETSRTLKEVPIITESVRDVGWHLIHLIHGKHE